MVLVKAPVALTGPSVVLLSAMVGLSEVLQTTPCSVGLGTQTRDVAVAGGSGRGNVGDSLGGNGGGEQRGERNILTIDCACRVGGICPDVIERIGCQAGNRAGEGTGGADRAIRGLAVGRGRVRRGRPDDAMLGGIGDTQESNVSIPNGGRGQDVRDSLGGDGGYDQSREGNFLAIHGGCVIRGVGADMIERTGRQAGHGAGECADRADRAIRGFAVCGGRVGRGAPDHAVLGWIRDAEGGNVAVPGGGRGGDIGDRLRGDRGREQGCEGDILAIDRAHIIGGISANVVQGTRRQVGDAAGEGTRRADRSIHGFIIQERGIGCRSPDHTMLGRDWANRSR